MPNLEKILEEIIKIDPDNKFLQYIVDRIQDNNYRGIHISQHNRYDLYRLKDILTGIYEIVGDNYFRIPLGDDTNGYRDPDCIEYYNIVDNIHKKIGMGTINSIKKNFFVDFQRMGFLERYNENMEPISPGKRGHVFWARLTPIAVKLIKSTLKNSYRIFTDAIDMLFANAITDLAETIYYSNYRDDVIKLEEFMFIISDSRPYIKDKKIELIDSYRSLAIWQQNKVKELIKKYCNPNNFEGNKTQKRDFDNWKNESQQIFTLLKNTVYFDITPEGLKLNTGLHGIFDDKLLKQRSLSAKQEYFKYHKVDRKEGFELHHIIAISLVKNKVEFQLVDNWRNLIYLDKDKHLEITKNGNKNSILTINERDVSFCDFDKNCIDAKNGVGALYNGVLSDNMQRYNTKLLLRILQFNRYDR